MEIKMKIFLTGSTGYLGSNIYKNISAEYFLYKRGNNIINNLIDFKPNYIIHNAGEIYKKEEMFNSNVVLTNEILQYVKKYDNIKMIYIGSSSEYGKVNSFMSENDKINPYSLYAATKSCGTLLCQAYAREFNRDICVVRPFSVYGTNEPSHRLIPTIYRNICANTKTTLINGSHDFIYIKDFIELIKILLESSSSKTTADIINCGTGISYSNIDVFSIMCKILNKNSPVEILDKSKQCDSEMWRCNIKYALDKYCFKYKYELNAGLQEYIDEQIL
jgi:nucleoside-diphosphate-sugar epimerase